ncbi:MAG: type II toxin-antitoxin system HicA family toxin [Synergistaceae bacterium]|nr:type II toxin-antitoxin system HicA family toxin [Synergistaceae bacterium]
MSRLEKAIERLKTVPKDYTYSEAKYILGQLGFIEKNKGRTSGSRVKFERQSDGAFVLLHKPHPSDIMSVGSVRDIIFILKELGEIE